MVNEHSTIKINCIVTDRHGKVLGKIQDNSIGYDSFVISKTIGLAELDSIFEIKNYISAYFNISDINAGQIESREVKIDVTGNMELWFICTPPSSYMINDTEISWFDYASIFLVNIPQTVIEVIFLEAPQLKNNLNRAVV